MANLLKISIDLHSLIFGSLSFLLLFIVISGLTRRKYRDIILPNLADSYDQIIRLSENLRRRYELTLQDRVDIKFPDIRRKKRLYIFKGLKEDLNTPFIPLQILFSIYGDEDNIPDPVIVTYKLSYPDYIRRATVNWFASFGGLITLYLALQYSLKLSLLNSIIYCSIISSLWALYRSRAADWTFGIKDFIASINIFLQNKLGFKNYDYYPGKIPMLISVPHATPPGGEVMVDYISKKIAKRLNAHLIIGKISRTILDLNRKKAHSSPFRRKIRDLIDKNGLVLILDIHGFSKKIKKTEMDVEIGTANLKTAKSEVRDLMTKALKENDIVVSVDSHFKGIHSPGNIINSYGNANTLNALQIEMHKKIRNFKSVKLNKVINGLVNGSIYILEALNK